MAERRTTSGGQGRREQDTAIYLLLRQVEALDKRCTTSFAEIKTDMHQLRDATDRRVRELEEFHLQDRQLAGEQIVEQTRRLQRQQRRVERLSVTVATLSMCLAAAEHFLHL